VLRRKNQLFKATKSLAPLLFVMVNIASILPSHSETYRALCDSKAEKECNKLNPSNNKGMGPNKPTNNRRSKCRVLIEIDGEAISSPNTRIPVSRVTSWAGGGSSKTNVGAGAFTTILLGPIGLLGFLAKNHASSFTINGYDVDAKRHRYHLDLKTTSNRKDLCKNYLSSQG